MGKVKNENYFQVQGWMVNELDLKGNELMIYAIIYGFSQTDDQYFTGSQQYLADWTNSTKKGIRKALQSLVEKGLLIKIDKVINNVKYCEYKALRHPLGGEQSSLGGGEQSSLGGEQSSPNNKENNILDIKENKIPYLKIRDMYNATCVSFPKLMSLSDARKKAIRARLKTYSVDDFELMFKKAEASSFLKGSNNRNWSATFDWLIKDSNMAKVLDGNYDNKVGQSKGNKVADQLEDSYKMIEEWVNEKT